MQRMEADRSQNFSIYFQVSYPTISTWVFDIVITEYNEGGTKLALQ